MSLLPRWLGDARTHLYLGPLSTSLLSHAGRILNDSVAARGTDPPLPRTSPVGSVHLAATETLRIRPACDEMRGEKRISHGYQGRRDMSHSRISRTQYFHLSSSELALKKL